MICGECGRTVTGEVQKQHHYYHCTKYNTNCSQEEYMREERIEKLLTSIFDGFNVESPIETWPFLQASVAIFLVL